MKDKIEKFRKEWRGHIMYGSSIETEREQARNKFDSQLDSLLKEIAEKAYHIGYDQIDYPPELTFEDYWKSVTDKIK